MNYEHTFKKNTQTLHVKTQNIIVSNYVHRIRTVDIVLLSLYNV